MSTLVHSDASQSASRIAQRRFAEAVVAAFRNLARRLREQRDVARTRRALASLDAATLRDLGIHRSETGSVAAEVHAMAQASRRVALALRQDTRPA
jgi:uncharacterized protein YjiS (DUF1127 family)